MSFVINVIKIDGPNKVPTKTGFYETIEVAYKKDGGGIEGKKIVSFNDPAIFEIAKVLVVGNNYEIFSEKKAGKDNKEYWHWVKIVPVDGDEAAKKPEAATAKSTSAGTSSRPTGKVTGSTYATSEERALVQRSIVRQSSISNALKLAELGKVKLNTPDDIFPLAEAIEDWVLREKDPVQAIIEMEDDIPV